MGQQAQNDDYADEAELALDLAAAVNEEIRDLFAAGADIVQIDEPCLQARPETAREYAIDAINRALDGVAGHDRFAHVLRLRPHRARSAAGLSVPRRAQRLRGRRAGDRGRSAAARLSVLGQVAGKR